MEEEIESGNSTADPYQDSEMFDYEAFNEEAVNNQSEISGQPTIKAVHSNLEIRHGKKSLSKRRKQQDAESGDESSDDDVSSTKLRRRRSKRKRTIVDNANEVIKFLVENDGDVTFDEDMSSDESDVEGCGECRGPFDESKKFSVTCDVCRKKVHRTCAQISSGKAPVKTPWRCPKCLSSPNLPTPTKQQAKNSQPAYLSALLDQDEVGELCTECQGPFESGYKAILNCTVCLEKSHWACAECALATSGTEPCKKTWLCNRCRKSSHPVAVVTPVATPRLVPPIKQRTMPVKQINNTQFPKPVTPQKLGATVRNLGPHKQFPAAQFSTPTKLASISTVSTLPNNPSVSLTSALTNQPNTLSPQASRMLPNLSLECKSKLSNSDSMLYKGITIFKSNSPLQTPTKSVTPASSGPRIVNRTPTKSPTVTPPRASSIGRISNGLNPGVIQQSKGATFAKTPSTQTRSPTTISTSNSLIRKKSKNSVSSRSTPVTPKSSSCYQTLNMSTSSQMSTQSNSDEEVLECFDQIPDTVVRNISFVPNGSVSLLRNGLNAFQSAINGFPVNNDSILDNIAEENTEVIDIDSDDDIEIVSETLAPVTSQELMTSQPSPFTLPQEQMTSQESLASFPSTIMISQQGHLTSQPKTAKSSGISKKTPKVSPRRADLAPSLYQKRPKNNLSTLFETPQESVNNVSSIATDNLVEPSIQDRLVNDISIVENLKNDILNCNDNSEATLQSENDTGLESDVFVWQNTSDIQESDIPTKKKAANDDSNSNDISDNLPKRIVKVLVDDMSYDALKRLGFEIVD